VVATWPEACDMAGKVIRPHLSNPLSYNPRYGPVLMTSKVTKMIGPVSISIVHTARNCVCQMGWWVYWRRVRQSSAGEIAFRWC